MLLLNEEPGFDRRERIADFVGDAGRQHAQRSELFLPFDEGLAFDQLHAQRRDQVTINDNRQARHREEKQSQR